MKRLLGPHVRAHRPILIPSVPVTEGIEIRHGCHVSLVAYFVPLLSYLVVLVGFCLAILVFICPGYGILVGISVLMVLNFQTIRILPSSMP